MRFSFSFLMLVLLAMAGPLFGCSPKERYFAPWEPSGPPAPETKLAFEDTGTITLSPREKRSFSIKADPPGPYEVNFFLLGQSLDGTLDRVTGVTDEEGRMSILLRAPNQPTTFTLRAFIDKGPTAQLPVSVSGDGFASISIVPQYKGKRLITGWTAMVVARKPCDEVAPTLPADTDGALFAVGAEGDELLVHDAPVGPIISVTVRAGHYAWGCTTTSGLIANETQTVKVNVIDKPLDLEATDLDVTLGLTADPGGPWGTLIGSARASVVDRFFPTDQAATATMLLDVMAGRVPIDDAAAFADARVAGAWDQVTLDHLGNQPSTLRGALELWLDEGFAVEPMELEGRLEAIAEVKNYATFSAVRMGSVPFKEAGMPGTHLVKISSDPGDALLLGAHLYWLPTLYVGGVAKRAALAGAPEGKTMTDALAEVAACSTLAEALVGFGTCDTLCVEALCRDALDWAFLEAQQGSALDNKVGEILINAATSALVDDAAVPLSCQGTWLGSVTDSVVNVKIEKGAISATPGSDLDPPL